MEPKLPVGSLIYVRAIQPGEIIVGDAITFYMQNTSVVATHEVYENDKQNELFRVQGINNRDEEGNILKDALPVRYDSLIGKVFFCIPYLGYVNQFCTTTPGIYILLGVVLFVVVLSLFIERENKTEVQKENHWKGDL